MKKLLYIALLLFFLIGCGSKEDSMVLNLNIINRRTPAQRAKSHCLKKAKEHINNKEYKKAEKYLLKAIEVDKKDPIICHKLGVLYELMGEDDKSIAYYLKAIKLDPELNKIEKEK
ncbi:MAG: tetratricopeptide repeat protein [bacterium]|nr:tetratricopeptide repeat protein [bacterium]